MTSAAKLKINQANARGSTGPKSVLGRRQSAQNAFRHGLARPLKSDPALIAKVEALAREIAGTGVSAELDELACRVAEAQIDLCRVREARHRLLSHHLGDPYYESRAATRAKVPVLYRLISASAGDLPDGLEQWLTSTPQGPHKMAAVLIEEARQLAALDRYERRALSRRKFAIRALDDARRQVAQQVSQAI
jgi:hypothetical protein